MKRNFKRNFMKNGGGGTLQNNPSSNLQDLDRELELLRRKRQMLESQQYQGGFNRPNPWEQAPRVNEYSAPSHSFNQSQFADLYDSQRPRQSAPSWQEPAAKRYRQQEFVSRPAARPFQGQQQFAPPKSYNPPTNFSGPKRPKGFVNPKPSFAKPKPGFANPKPGFANSKPGFANPKPGFANPKPSFASKPAPQPAPNNATAQPSKRQNAQGEPKNVRFLDFVVKDTNEPFPPVVKGRLEAVLGDLFRGLKERSGSEIALDLSRYVKKVYRDRIRKAMQGKPGTAENIANQYKKAHPLNDDALVLRLAKQLQTKVAMEKGKLDGSELEENPFLKNIVATAGSPELYFMQNMEIVITNKMEELLQRVQKTYEEDDLNCLQQLIQEVDQISKEQEQKKTDGEETANGDVAEKENGAENDESAPVTEEPATEDSSEAKAEDGTTEETPAEAAETSAEAMETGGEAAAETREEYYSKLMQALIKRELPNVLPSFKTDIVKLLSVDIKYSTAQKIIAKQAAAIPRTATKKPECYVMLLGDPQLPRKERLQVFLNKFNPASIKRHKRVRNVLYIGFSDKKDFDNIIAEDGLVLTNMKLSIKESKSYRDNHFTIQKGAAKLLEPTPAKTDANASGTDASEANANEANTSEANTEEEKSLIDSDIDSQINDLLSSIRKSENDNTSADAADNQAGDVTEAAEDTNDVTEATETADGSNGVAEATGDTENGVEASEEVANDEEMTEEAKDSSEVPKTPIRASTRLAGGIKTRRASRLAQ